MMAGMKRIAARAVLLVLLLAQPGFAQSSGGLKARLFELRIIVDAFAAEISVDNTVLDGNVAKVPAGAHGVRVRAEGFYDFFETVSVAADRTIVVQMKPRTYPVTIRANVVNAAIFVDDRQIVGTMATVTAGSHTVRVSAEGYEDYLTSISVAAPMVIDAVLERAGYLLVVNANVKSARVAVNGISRGTVPYSEYLPPGAYTVKVSARGYTDYVASVALDGPVTINANLSQGPAAGGSAFLTFVLPDEFLDPEVKDRSAGDLVRIYIDGRLANPKRELERIPVSPGRHFVRVASGAFSVQIGEIEFFPGTSYTFELSMDIGVRGERKAGSY
jgi:hypothetical protein